MRILRGLSVQPDLKQKDPRSGARGLSRGSTQITPRGASQHAGNGASVRLSEPWLFRLYAGRGFSEAPTGQVHTLSASLTVDFSLLVLRHRNYRKSITPPRLSARVRDGQIFYKNAITLSSSDLDRAGSRYPKAGSRNIKKTVIGNPNRTVFLPLRVEWSGSYRMLAYEFTIIILLRIWAVLRIMAMPWQYFSSESCTARSTSARLIPFPVTMYSNSISSKT